MVAPKQGEEMMSVSQHWQHLVERPSQRSGNSLLALSRIESVGRKQFIFSVVFVLFFLILRKLQDFVREVLAWTTGNLNIENE